MTKLKMLSSLLLISLLAACAGGDDGDGVTGLTSISIPSDAIEINDQNASTIAVSAVASFDTAATLIGVEASLPSPVTAIETIADIVFNKDKVSSPIATGIVETSDCLVSGTESDNYTETANGGSGTYSFNQCDDGTIKLNGSVNYSYTWIPATGEYTDAGNGNLTVTTFGDSFAMVFNYDSSGNDFSGNATISINFSLTGSNLGGYMVTTTQPLTILNFNNASTGQVIVSGANNTRLRITLTSTITADVELDTGDGVFVFHSNISI